MKKIGFCRSGSPVPAVLFALAILDSAGAFAADNSRPRTFPDSATLAVTIDSENLIELLRSVTDFEIIDSCHPGNREPGYVETTHDLPRLETDCAALAKLAKSTDQAMVFYCNGNLGDASIEAIQIASGCEYKRFFRFRGGFVECEDKDYPYVIE